jgi:hypothetical protein
MTQREYVLLTDDEQSDLIGSNDAAKCEQVSNLFFQLSEQEQGSLLSGYCTDDRESYDDNPEISDVCFDTNLKGTIEVNFTGSVYIGCRDMDYEKEHSELLKFEIDQESSRIWFESEPPDPPERPLDDI